MNVNEIKAPNDYRFNLRTIEHLGSTGYNLTDKIPHKLKAEDFLSFAEDDMKGDSDKDIVNTLGNLKRAIENRMDCLLFAFKYYEQAKNLNFPDKVQKLNKLGIVAPRILAKINRIRNLLEHQYQIPKRRDIEEAYDIAILFLAYTNRFITNFATDGDFYIDGEESKRYMIHFEWEENSVRIKLGKVEYDLKPTNPVFDDWVKLLVTAQYK